MLEFDSLMRKCDEEWSDGYKTALEKYGSVDAMFNAEDTAYVGYAKTKFTINMPDGSHITERQDIGDGVGGVIDFLKQYPQYKDVARNLQQAANREESRNEIGRKAKASVKRL